MPQFERKWANWRVEGEKPPGNELTKPTKALLSVLSVPSGVTFEGLETRADTGSDSQNESEQSWPKECIEAERRFGQRHARLFPLLEREVSTPSGIGTLIQVFATRAVIKLASAIVYVHPDQVSPAESAQI